MRKKPFYIIALPCLLAVLFSLFVLPGAIAAKTPEKTPEKTPACVTTGEHRPGKWTPTGSGKHTSVCKACGEPLEADCVFASPAVFTPGKKGTHYRKCTVCRGRQTEACVYGKPEKTLPTQTEPGIATSVCKKCGNSVSETYAPAEMKRAESRMMGDIYNLGQTNADCARAILRAAVGLEPIKTKALPYADMDENGRITAEDARLALRVSVGLTDARRHDIRMQVTKTPTCISTGELTWKCVYCKTEKKLVIPESGHQWVEATAKAAKHCKLCGMKVTGVYSANGKTYYFNKDGTPLAGKTLKKTDVKGKEALWFFNNGVLDKDFKGIIAYNNKNLYVHGGKADTEWHGALSYGGSDWIVEKGAARKVETPSDRTLFRAFGEVKKATTPDMTPEEKLRACFVYCKQNYHECRPRTPHYCEIDWPLLYANDMFVGSGGNCLSFAAAYAYMAKAIGYEDVYCCNSGGHGWAEVNGNVFDPEWSKRDGLSAVTYFNLSYDAHTDVRYKQAIASNQPWMHVKVQPNMKITNLYNRCKAENNRYF